MTETPKKVILCGRRKIQHYVKCGKNGRTKSLNVCRKCPHYRGESSTYVFCSYGYPEPQDKKR